MSDNKLTEFEEDEPVQITEFEKNLLSLIIKCTNIGDEWFDNDFVRELRQIMPPICTQDERDYLDRVRKLMQGDHETEFCTENERKFLDRIKERFKYESHSRGVLIPKRFGSPSQICQVDFSDDINLKELVE